MEKLQIICPIRKANPYRRMAIATKEHRTLPNLLNRKFKQGIARKVLLTDITYLSYGKGKRAYLFAIKDAETNEILAYETSDKSTLDIALNTLVEKEWDKIGRRRIYSLRSRVPLYQPPISKDVKEKWD